MAKSVSGKIEWLASHGSLIRLDAVSLGLAPEQTGGDNPRSKEGSTRRKNTQADNARA